MSTTTTTISTTMRAVRCHRFAYVEKNNDKEQEPPKGKSGRRRKAFKPRSPNPLKLRDCLSLDTIPVPDEYNNNNNNNTLSSSGSSSSISDTQILIRTEYAGIQYPDALQAQGLYQVKPKLPYIPGMDVVGIVVKVIPPSASPSPSPSATSAVPNAIRPGDRVLAAMLEFGGTGGMSELVLAPLKYVHKLPPPGIIEAPQIQQSAAVFANVGRNYFAAYHSLVEVGNIQPSAAADNKNKNIIVLVTGASGGVGMATIELAKAMGCKVIAGVGSLQKMDGPKSVGADAVFCYGRSKKERRNFKTQVLRFCASTATAANVGVDLIVDMVMGDLFEEALIGCVKPLGTIALVGFAAGQRPIRPGLLLVKEVRVAGSMWVSIAAEASEISESASAASSASNASNNNNNNNKYRDMVETIFGYFASGKIRGRVDRIVPLSNFIDAFEVFEVNKGRGNTVVSFVDDNNDDNNIRRSSRL